MTNSIINALNYDSPVIVDIETGGLDPKEHPIIQIAALHPLSGDEFEVKLEFDPEEVDEAVLKEVQYDPDVWAAEAIPPPKAFSRFCKFLRDHASLKKESRRGARYEVASVMGWNFAFDHSFLFHHLNSRRIFIPYDLRFYDALQLALWMMPGLSSYRLGDVADHLQINSDGAHDALVDCRMTLEVVRVLLKDTFEESSLPEWI